MKILDLFQRKSSPKIERARKVELFDDEFQRKLEMLALVSRRVFAGRLRAERRTKKKGSGVEFADHRDYVEGDDFRSVDWNVYQRFGKLLVRLYEEEEDLSIYFLIDCSASMAFGNGKKFDQARRIVAALAYVGLASAARAGFSRCFVFSRASRPAVSPTSVRRSRPSARSTSGAGSRSW
jgi:uncharacterized protein (DUF58 family)